MEQHFEFHRGEEPEYTMKLVEYSVLPLQRQAKEGHLIGNFKGGILMNRKGEWGQNLPPKLVVDGEEEDTGRKRDRRGNEREERKEERAGKRCKTEKEKREGQDPDGDEGGKKNENFPAGESTTDG